MVTPIDEGKNFKRIVYKAPLNILQVLCQLLQANVHIHHRCTRMVVNCIHIFNNSRMSNRVKCDRIGYEGNTNAF